MMRWTMKKLSSHCLTKILKKLREELMWAAKSPPRLNLGSYDFKCSDRVHDLLGLLRVGHQATTIWGAGHQFLLFLNFPSRVASDNNHYYFQSIKIFVYVWHYLNWRGNVSKLSKKTMYFNANTSWPYFGVKLRKKIAYSYLKVT